MDDEGDVITRRHSQHLAFDADLQTFRGKQRAAVLLGALLLVQSSLAQVGHHLPVAETQHRTVEALEVCAEARVVRTEGVSVRVHRPGARPVVLSKAAVFGWGVWIVPEVSEAAFALDVGPFETVVTVHTHTHDELMY